MNCLLNFNESFSVATLIKKQLNSIYDLSNINFSIDLSKNQNDIIYKSSLCLQLAKVEQKSSLYLAQKIAGIFNHGDLKQDILVKISGNGWLEFLISDRLLNQWLNEVNKIKFSPLNISIIKQDKNQKEFLTYYSHARCCSILKSGHQQNIITLNNLDFKLNQWHIEKPNFINYKMINLSGSYEQKLIKELIIITEKIANNKLNYQTSLNNLSKAILDVECYCRIWGETLTKNLLISQGRLGLIAVSLNFYQNLLDYGLITKLDK
jgi:arginyl-tRNA synthetase